MADTDTTTSLYALNKPAKGKQDWDVPLNDNFDDIDEGMACARTHLRTVEIPYAEALVIKPQPGYAQGYIAVTGNITSMSLDFSDLLAVTKPGDMIVWELRINPSENVSIAWPSNIVWMNGAVPLLNGTKYLRVVFTTGHNWEGILGSFMGWEG